MRTYCLFAIFALILLFQSGLTIAIPFEVTVSNRYSVRTFAPQAVSSTQLLTILRSSYGYVGRNRVLPRIGNEYSLVIYVVNASGSYRYEPETNSLAEHNLAVNKEKIRPYDSGWPSNANVVLIIVWDQSRISNEYFASAEAGCFVQNVHLAAITENLGTTCVGLISSSGLRSELGLPSTMIPILVMPLGYPTSPYDSDATPDYSRMNGNLPFAQTIGMSFSEALNDMNYSQAWSGLELSLQETSQLLWAAYGYSSSDHRTTPSAYGIYPLLIYMLNSTGTYRYIEESHSIIQIQTGDKRSSIATACDNQMWAASAPAIFLVSLDSAYYSGNIGDGGVLDHEFVEVDAGCVVQQILLEASAIGLEGNVVVDGIEDWNGDTAQTIRYILDLPPSIISLYIVPVGRVSGTPIPTPIPTPTSTPLPTPTSTPTDAASISPSPSPYLSPSPSPQATPTPSLFPTSTPEPQSTDIPVEFIFVIVGVIVFLVAVLAIIFYKKRK